MDLITKKNLGDPSWFESNVFDKGKTLRELAVGEGISYYTMLRYFKQHFRCKNIHELITLSKRVSDIKILISQRSKEDSILLDEVYSKTKFVRSGASLRERLWFIEHDTNLPPVCGLCNISSTKWNKDLQQFHRFCSTKCGSNDSRTTQKREDTNLKNRGVRYPAQCVEVRDKCAATMLANYGVRFANQQHVPLLSLERLQSREWMSNVINFKTTFEIADDLNVSQSVVSKYINKHGLVCIRHQSLFERSVISFLLGENFDVVQNSRKIIPPYELDIFIPSHRIAVECNGVYWHSELNNKNKNYHLEKTKACISKNITLFHVWDSEWATQQQIVKSRLSHGLHITPTSIYARKCKVRSISNSEAVVFYTENHLQGSLNSSYHLGLFYNDVLVMCMSFSRPRFNTKFDYELTRSCAVINHRVIGGISKLFNFFTSTVVCDSIISYADRRFGEGNGYEQIGFSLLHETSPNYHYFLPNGPLLSRVMFQKHKLKSKLITFDSDLTEWENMQANNYNRVWDCGNNVYAWTR